MPGVLEPTDATSTLRARAFLHGLPAICDDEPVATLALVPGVPMKTRVGIALVQGLQDDLQQGRGTGQGQRMLLAKKVGCWEFRACSSSSGMAGKNMPATPSAASFNGCDRPANERFAPCHVM